MGMEFQPAAHESQRRAYASSGGNHLPATLSLLCRAALLLAATGVAASAQQAYAWPEADRLFRSDPLWLGSDGAFSVDLGAGRVLWLFGDTLIARDPAQGRKNAFFVRNTVGIATGYDPTSAHMKFYWRKGGRMELFPSEGQVWLWPQSGIRVGPTLVLFCSRVAPTRATGPMAFRSAGWQAYAVANPDDDVLRWRLRKVVEDRGPVIVGSAALREGAFVYFLGTSEPEHDLYLARWPAAEVQAGRFDPLEWWCGDGWRADPSARRTVMTGVSTEASLQRDPHGNGYIEINSQGFGATDIVMRRAGRLEGPWSGPVKIYRPPESDAKGAFVYAGKSHPEQTGADLVVTYATNSFDDSALGDARLYFPRFVRVSLAPAPR